MKKTLILAAPIVLAACAQSPERIAALTLDREVYRSMSCSDIQMRRDLNKSMIADYSAKQVRARAVDGILAPMGWPLATLSGGNRAYDIARMRGEQYALLVTANEKDCTVS
ncbi:MAG: hypothetical protein AAGB15_15235 [Pseudomonadota bacterium]